MYVAKDEGSGIEKELDSDQTKSMEEGGKKKHANVLSVLPENCLTWSF